MPSKQKSLMDVREISLTSSELGYIMLDLLLVIGSESAMVNRDAPSSSEDMYSSEDE